MITFMFLPNIYILTCVHLFSNSYAVFTERRLQKFDGFAFQFYSASVHPFRDVPRLRREDTIHLQDITSPPTSSDAI